MSQDHHQGHGAHVHGVLDGADLVRGRDVAGHPDHKNIADALIEDDFRRHPGVGAGEDRGQGVLALSRSQGAALRSLVGMLEFAVDVTSIAFLEDPEGFIGGYPRARSGRRRGCRQGRGHQDDNHQEADFFHQKLLQASGAAVSGRHR